MAADGGCYRWHLADRPRSPRARPHCDCVAAPPRIFKLNGCGWAVAAPYCNLSTTSHRATMLPAEGSLNRLGSPLFSARRGHYPCVPGAAARLQQPSSGAGPPVRPFCRTQLSPLPIGAYRRRAPLPSHMLRGDYLMSVMRTYVAYSGSVVRPSSFAIRTRVAHPSARGRCHWPGPAQRTSSFLSLSFS